MAKIRELKNEVNFLTYEIIADCNTYMYLNPARRTQVMALIEEAVSLRNKIIGQINHPATDDPKYFKKLRADLIVGADAIFSKLRELIK
jgi:2-polyprenyl-6-methoxyphenol hydroxylase-like FAD-dependent oxidoreductase